MWPCNEVALIIGLSIGLLIFWNRKPIGFLDLGHLELTSNAPLLKLKLLDALKSNDVAKVNRVYEAASSSSPQIVHLKLQILHLAVQVALTALFKQLITSPTYHAFINKQDDHGNTPLHCACAAQRTEIVEILLADPDINDTILNSANQQPLDMIRNNPLLFNYVQTLRIRYVEKVLTELRKGFTKRDFKKLDAIFSNPRNVELLDINGLDPETGDTVLHEFIKKRDVEMVAWILAHGADPFRRDKRGKLPLEILSKLKASGQADQLKKMLKKASKDQSVVDPVSNTQMVLINLRGVMEQAPTYKGYLKKWTNFASGYKLRWFILDSQGILSYYKNQDDINSNCRGLINLKNCRLHLDLSEKLKFEILGVRNANIKWHLKGNHSVETSRWVWSISNAMKFARDREKNAKKIQASTDSVDQVPRLSTRVESESHLLALHEGHSRTPLSASVALRISLIRRPLDQNHDEPGSENASLEDDIEDNASENDLDVLQFDDDLDLVLIESDSLFDHDITSTKFIGPHGSEITRLQKTLWVELNLLQELAQSTKQNDEVVLSTARESMEGVLSDYKQLLRLVHKNNFKIVKKLTNEMNVNLLWELSIKELEQENVKNAQKVEHYEKERKQLRKILREKLLHPGSDAALLDDGELGLRRIVSDAVRDAEEERGKETNPIELSETTSGSVSSPKGAATPKAELLTPVLTGTGEVSSPRRGSFMVSDRDQKLMDFVEEEDSDSDDEFFDFDDEDGSPFSDGEETAYLDDQAQSVNNASTAEPDASKNLPVNVPSKLNKDISIAAPVPSIQDSASDTTKQNITEDDITLPAPIPLNEVQKEKNAKLLAEKSYNGYEDPIRTKLLKDEDDRPKISLWVTLKLMVGKDMTKITLPVSFNECTSLLQRVAEGVEYTELLDKAALIDLLTLRMCYVAAFGASEYALTINRVAKPFNPLLGETFEYARPDKNFRFLVEQVSHHPPISAALAESPKWDYYGESAVKSKFNGRSFDIKPLGKWYLQMRPDHGVEGQAEELYTWNRVTSSVVGIIIGNPVVDNYGQMEIKNHTTGDHVVLDFKARGWRASSAYEVKGTVYNKNNKPCYLIKGHWNLKIYCKKIVLEHENFDENSSEKFLLWQVNPRPPRPFNLTLFLILLNALQPRLKRWLAPTDTRFRPDQRAMEDGRYDAAAEEKNRVEEKQRAARKARESKGEQYKAKYFEKRQHALTGEGYWHYNGNYWKSRGHLDGDIF